MCTDTEEGSIESKEKDRGWGFVFLIVVSLYWLKSEDRIIRGTAGKWEEIWKTAAKMRFSCEKTK